MPDSTLDPCVRCDTHHTPVLSPTLSAATRRAAFLAVLTDAELERVCGWLWGDFSYPMPVGVWSHRPHVAGESLIDRLVSL